jgi:hypothetical protein
MLMKAIDTLHVSAVGPENIQPGQTFEINDGDGAILHERGLAVPVEGGIGEGGSVEGDPGAAPSPKARAK